MSHRPRHPVPLLVALAAGMAACGGSAGVNSPAPVVPTTPAPSVAPGALQPGSLLTGDTFTARVPVDWSVLPTTTPNSGGPTPTKVRSTEIDSPRRDAALIILEYPDAIFPTAVLNMDLNDFVSRVITLPTGSASPEAVQQRTQISVAGTPGVELAFQDVYKGKPGYSRFAVFRRAGTVYVLTLGTKPTLAPSYSPALDTVLTTWTWTK